VKIACPSRNALNNLHDLPYGTFWGKRRSNANFHRFWRFGGGSKSKKKWNPRKAEVGLEEGVAAATGVFLERTG
jgi:hypothetical protein